MPDQLAGIAIARVTDNHDPLGQGQVEVFFPWLGKDSPRRWCSVASVAAGGDRGLFFMPEVDDEVLVAADQACFDHVYIIGYPWNPVQSPPSNHPDQRMIRSREGHTIRFVDSEENAGNRGALIVEDASGNVITMTNGVMTIHCQGHLSIEANTMTIMGRPVDPMCGAI